MTPYDLTSLKPTGIEYGDKSSGYWLTLYTHDDYDDYDSKQVVLLTTRSSRRGIDLVYRAYATPDRDRLLDLLTRFHAALDSDDPVTRGDEVVTPWGVLASLDRVSACTYEDYENWLSRPRSKAGRVVPEAIAYFVGYFPDDARDLAAELVVANAGHTIWAEADEAIKRACGVKEVRS